jgi:hypothetical protein
VEAAAWFGKTNAGKLYREFKSVVAAALIAELEIDSIRQYPEISGRENADAERCRWLKLYAGGHALYCFWPTVCAVQKVIHAGEKNELLVQMEQEIISCEAIEDFEDSVSPSVTQGSAYS